MPGVIFYISSLSSSFTSNKIGRPLLPPHISAHYSPPHLLQVAPCTISLWMTAVFSSWLPPLSFFSISFCNSVLSGTGMSYGFRLQISPLLKPSHYIWKKQLFKHGTSYVTSISQHACFFSVVHIPTNLILFLSPKASLCLGIYCSLFLEYSSPSLMANSASSFIS